MRIPVLMPELHAAPEPVWISTWLVEPGDAVAEGDRLVEVLMPGVTFDVSAPADGLLTEIVKPTGATVQPQDILAWLETNHPAQ